MASRVTIPTRVQVGPESVASPDVVQGVDRATRRALQASRKTVLGPRRTARVHAADIKWGGAALAAVDTKTRAGVELALTRAIAKAAADVVGRPARRASQKPAQLWSVVKTVEFHARLGGLIQFLGKYGADTSELEDLYRERLDTAQRASVTVVKVRQAVWLRPLMERIANEQADRIRSDAMVHWAYSTKPEDRLHLAFLDRDRILSRELPSLDTNSAYVGGEGDSAFALGGALVLLLMLQLPKVRFAQALDFGMETGVPLPLRELEFLVGAKSFERLFGVDWERYVQEFGDEPEELRILPIFTSKRTHYRTLRRLVGDVVLRDTPSDSVVFGNLHLLTSAYVESLPAPARPAAVEASNAQVLGLPASTEDGYWEKEWSGAYVYTALKVVSARVAAARFRDEARKVADELAPIVAEREDLSPWHARFATFVRRHYRESRDDREQAFEFLLAELKHRKAFDEFFDGVDSSADFGYWVGDLVWKTKYRTDPRVQATIEKLNRRTQSYRFHTYRPEEREIWLDHDPRAAVRIGMVVRDAAWGYSTTLKEQRLREDRQAELNSAIERHAKDGIAALFENRDKTEYKTVDDFFAVVAAKAAKEIGLTQDDLEEVEIGQRSARIRGIERRLEGPWVRFYITYDLVDQLEGTTGWTQVKGTTATVSDTKFEELLWSWHYEHTSEIIILASKISIAVSLLPLLPIVFPEMLVIAGGAQAVALAVALSEAIYVITTLYQGKELTVEGFVIAAIEGYLGAVAFGGANVAARAIFGGAEAIAARTVTAALGRWVLSKLFVGVVGGGATAIMNQFVRDLVEATILRQRGRWHTPWQYAEEMGKGMAFGVAFEIVGGPALKLGMKGVSNAFKSALEASESSLQSASDVAEFFFARGVTVESLAEFGEQALKQIDDRMSSLFQEATAKKIVDAFRRNIDDVVGQLRGVVAEDLLRLANVELSAVERQALESLLARVGPDLATDDVRVLIQRLGTHPRDLKVFLNSVGALERDTLQQLISARQLEAFSTSPGVQRLAAGPGGAARLAALRQAFGDSLPDAERFLARIALHEPGLQSRVLAAALRPGAPSPPGSLATAAERAGVLTDEMVAGLDRLFGSDEGRKVAAGVLGQTPARNLQPVLELLGRVSPEEARLLVSGRYLPALARNPRALAFAGQPGAVPLLRKLVGAGGVTSRFGKDPEVVFDVLERVLRKHPGASADELVGVVDRLASPLSELSEAELRRALGEVDEATAKLLGKLTNDELKLLRGPLDEEALDLLRAKLTDPELRQVYDALFPGQTPAVWRPKSDPHIEGRKVPQGTVDPTGKVIRPGPTRMDIEDLPLKPGETVPEAMDRVGTVIGKTIDHNKAVADVWERARQDVLGNRNPHTDVPREEMLRKGGIYDQVRDRFWFLVRRPENKAVNDFFRNAGFDTSGTGAPLLETTGQKQLIDEMRRISLDHMEGFEKATGMNYRFAVDAANLSFEFQYPNTLRDAIGRRLGLGAYTKPRELP